MSRRSRSERIHEWAAHRRPPLLSREDGPEILEATQWLLRLSDEHASGEDVAEWQQWLAADPLRRVSFERAQAIWDAVPALPSPHWPTDREVAEDSYDASIPVAQALNIADLAGWLQGLEKALPVSVSFQANAVAIESIDPK